MKKAMDKKPKKTKRNHDAEWAEMMDRIWRRKSYALMVGEDQ